MASITQPTTLRYRYRAYPDAAQRQMLAKTFGCTRVVYNDGLQIRLDAYKAGLPYVPDAELRRRVTVQAKRTPERAFLADVSAVALQQSVEDLHYAYRRFFAAVRTQKAALAKGRKARLGARAPKFKSRRGEQSARFVGEGFRVVDRGVRLAKIGALRVRWSRPLPSEPTCVTVTLDTAGRYHVSFVVKVAGTRLPLLSNEVGIDLGVDSFATLSTGEKITNPRWLRQREKALRRSQRNMDRKQKGSRNREEARLRVARLHAQVADTRRDFHHKLSTRIIRENQAVYVETITLTGLGGWKTAKSIHDAAWGQFTGMLAYKADLYGRTFVKIDRWFPSSQICSVCGHRDGAKRLKIREWTCPECFTTHDRDVNAALNILAAGRAVAACGGDVRPPLAVAVADEAGTHRGAA